MPRLYKRGRTWYADLKNPFGERIRISLETTRKDVASEKLHAYELAQANPAAHSKQTLVDCLEVYFDRGMTGRSKETVGAYAQKARHLLRVFGQDRQVVSIKRSDVQDYVALRVKEGASKSTIHKELVVYRQAVKDSVRNELLPQGAIDAIITVDPEYTPRDLYLTPPQLMQVLAETMRPLPARTEAKRKRDEARATNRRRWICLAGFAGLRASEVEALAWSSVNFSSGFIRVNGTKTKGSFRLVPIIEPLRRILEEVPTEERTGTVVEPWGNRRRDIHLLCDKAGAPRVTANDLRRTFASWMLQAGEQIFTVAKMLGHNSTKMVEKVYGQLSNDTYLKAAERCALFVSDSTKNMANSARCDAKAENEKPSKTCHTVRFRGFQGRAQHDLNVRPTDSKCSVLSVLDGGKAKRKKKAG